MTELNYDPHLRKAMDEITQIMKSYDIGGFISLDSRTHGEFKLFLEPSWSMVRPLQNPDKSLKGFHFKVRKNQMVEVNATASMVYGIRDTCTQGFMAMSQLIKDLEKYLDIEHTETIINNDGRESSNHEL